MKSFRSHLLAAKYHAFLIVLWLFIFPQSLFSDDALIVGDNVNIRETPSIKGKVLLGIQFGDTVELLDGDRTFQLSDIQKIGNFSHVWYKVRHAKITGYIFGPYLASKSCKSPDSEYQFWVATRQFMGASNPIMVYKLNRGRKPISSFEVAASDYSFSGDCRYLAVDNGTDVTRQIEFFDTADGRKVSGLGRLIVNGGRYNDLRWTPEDKLFFARTDPNTGTVPCWPYTEVFFQNGKIIETRRKGKMASHLTSGPTCKDIQPSGD